jgi:hypothetical protein
MNVEKYISPLIASQFPSFYKEEGPNFIAFVKAYYEWAEQQDNFINLSRSLYDIKDIDNTPEAYVRYFKNKYISSLPESIISDKKLLVKHILELYRTKGTQRAYELLFRILFNEDISFYIPGKYVLKSSEANWYVPKYIEVSDHPLLKDLVGRRIYTRKDGFATVENYFIKIVNNKTVNVLTLSGLEGTFKFNEQIFCNDYPEITSANAPIIFGSLSSVSITNGGSGFNIGDLLKVEGAGKGGVARVAATRQENGKVDFKLVNGGFGFSVNAVVTVTGGYGAGASFQIGGITDKRVYLINRDKINLYENTVIEDPAAGLKLSISSPTGTFQTGEKIISTAANTRILDVQQLYSAAANGESFSNSSLGITGIIAYKVDGNAIFITGTDANITNANLAQGAILVSNTTSAIVKVNNVSSKRTIPAANGIVLTANTSEVIVNQLGNNYIIPGSTITGNVHSYTATVTATYRETDWMFPYPTALGKKSNLDLSIQELLNVYTLEAGTITYLKNVNPGLGYSANPTVSVVEPDIYDFRIQDEAGGYYGYDAIITAKAGSANGVVTAVEIVDSGYGYNPDESVYLNSANNAAAVTGVSVVDLNGKGAGSWKNNQSFLSDTINIQDSYYYQNFSYEIVAPRMLDTYEKYVKDLIHPSGMLLFGKYALNSEITDNYAMAETFSLQQS